MKKQEAVRDENKITIIPEYGRQRLLTYAESFQDLAELFEEEDNAHNDSWEEQKDRQDYLWKRKLQENQGLLAEHLKEMAHIMVQVAKETYLYRPAGERKFRQMAKFLKESGILLKNYFELEREDGHMELALTMKSAGDKHGRFGDIDRVSVEDIADYISVAVNRRLCASKNTPFYMTREWNTYYFMQEPAFHILTGVAKAVKETEKISGDNYSFYEADTGKMEILLSDGMGSGEKASGDSERVIEIMERLFEAGFSKEAAVQMVNGALAATAQEQNMPTLDICEIDLYTGLCDFLKVGAASTYIKRGQLVDMLSARNLPLGVFSQIEPDVIRRTLQSGDYIIMLSDGIADALSQGIGEEALPEIIGRMDYGSPKEIANQILGYCIRQSRGQIRDDMTVLVTGIWNQVENVEPLC